MKTKMLVAAFALVFFSGCSTMHASQRAQDDLLIEARAVHKKFLAAFNANDAQALSALYSKDPQVTLYPPDEMAAKGSAAIETSFRSMAKGIPGAMLSMTEEHFRADGESVYAWGLWEMTLPGPRGKSIKMNGRFTEYLVVEDGKLVLLVDHASVPVGGKSDRVKKPSKKKSRRK